MFLEKHQIGSLPVMKNRELIGIITGTDFSERAEHRARNR